MIIAQYNPHKSYDGTLKGWDGAPRSDCFIIIEGFNTRNGTSRVKTLAVNRTPIEQSWIRGYGGQPPTYLNNFRLEFIY